jgi:tRNA (guanine6-N2)-methyltransferase
MWLLLTTAAGLEDLVLAEAQEIGARAVETQQGRVIVDGPETLIPRLNLQVKCSEHVYVVLARESVESLEDIYRVTKEAECTILSRNQSFAVRASRVGSHPFRSQDVAGYVGQAIIDAHLAEDKPRPPVSLNYPRVEFRAWLREDDFILGVNTTGEGLHKRRYRVYRHPAPLNPCIAAAMLRLAGDEGRDLLDPFCGSGTILVEAAHRVRRVHNGCLRSDFAMLDLPWHDVHVYRELLLELTEDMNRNAVGLKGVDISPKHLRGARLNARAAFVEDTISLERGDAARLGGEIPNLVVTNPPYGLRVGRAGHLDAIYRGFASALADRTGTQLVIISAYPRLDEALADLKLLEDRRILYGDLVTRLRHYLVE